MRKTEFIPKFSSFIRHRQCKAQMLVKITKMNGIQRETRAAATQLK